MTKKTKTKTLQPGTKVKLGDGRIGTVLRNVERAGFIGSIVRIDSSVDKSQIGQTVGATVPGMKVTSQLQPAEQDPGKLTTPITPTQTVDEPEEFVKEQQELYKKQIPFKQKELQQKQEELTALQQMAQEPCYISKV